MIYFIIVTIAAALGLAISLFIHFRKAKKRPLVCPLNFDCEKVTKSEHSKFFGIPIELLGIVYYLLIFLSYLLFVAEPVSVSPQIIFLALGLSIVASLFSLYLTFIQGAVLKEWCTWCLGSAILSIIILVFSFVGSAENIIVILESYHSYILLLHMLGLVLGLGGATFTDFFFFTFLKDFKISKSEAETLKIFSQIIWLGLAILVLSGIGLYLPHAEALNHSPKFLVKMIVVAVIILNGAILNLLISPKLINLSFINKEKREKPKIANLRKLAFATGAISITSWYSAFILGSLRKIPLNFWQLLIAYLWILFLAVLISQFVEILFKNKAKEN